MRSIVVELVNGNIICRLGVHIDGRWIYKENGASQTDIESFKGGISGAFKRVASSGYGIGRYLYNIESNFAECSLTKKDEFTEKAKTKDGKFIYWKIPNITKNYKISKEQVKRLCTIQNKAKVEDEQLKQYLNKQFGINSRKDLNKIQYEKVIKKLENTIKQKEAV